MQITLKQLTHFVAAARTGQVSRAAARCFVSQPSLTASLQKLEAQLDTALFTRHSDGLRLTAQGERFLARAEHVLATLETAIAETRQDVSPVTGTFQLPVTDTISQFLLPRILVPLRRRFPDVTLEVIEGERPAIEAQLLAGEYEFALLLVSNVATDGIERETLLRSPRRLWTASGHAVAGHAPVSLARIRELPYILLDMDDHLRTVDGYWSQWGLAPQVVFTSKSIEAVRSLVAQNVGVTILSDIVYRPWSLDGARIQRTPVLEAVPSMDIGLARRTGQPSSAVGRAVAEALRTMLAEMTPLAEEAPP